MEQKFKIEKNDLRRQKQDEKRKSETQSLLNKLKLTLFFAVSIVLTIYTTIDIFVFHQGDLEKTVFTLNFHEFWVYLIIAIFFIVIYFFSHLIVNKQIEIDRKILESERKLSQLRRDLITRVSHELKTPLNAIYGASQMLLRYEKEGLDPYILKYINGINKGSDKLNLLIEDLIDCSKIEFNKLILNKQMENIVDIIKESVDDMIYLVNKRSLFLDVDIPEEIYVEVDRIRIEQVITNLISNAIKNTPINGTINIKLLENDEYVDFSIIDSGIGFTNEEKKRIFKKFGKIERHGECLGLDSEGSGLGLFISKEIVERHGGKIWVESEGRNKGSIFTVRLLKNKPYIKIE